MRTIPAKQAIKARCADCSGRQCEHTDCDLYGLAGAAPGKKRTLAIRRYCSWCMNGNPIRLCASPECPIYKYRAETKGALKIDFTPSKPRIGDGIRVSGEEVAL